MENKENNIPIIEGEFKPAMAEISLMMDRLLKLAEAGDQDAGELYKQAERSLFNLVDILEVSQNWSKFKEEKKLKETNELVNEVNPKKREVV